MTAKLKQNQIVLDKVRTLAPFDFNLFASVEAITGKNLLAPDVWDHLNATDIRAILFASLSQEDPSLTLEGVGKLLTVKNAATTTNRLFKLFQGEDASPLAGESG